jgi:AcrR family transcriptional regulator
MAGGTRARIVDTAVRLFNESGSGAISTNHIAQALGISPGNLYYHFANKEAIVRAVFARLHEAWTAAAALPADRPPAVTDLRHILIAYLEVVWEYRFYYREIPVLMQRDPELARLYQAERRQGLANIEALMRYFVVAGVMRLPDDGAAAPETAPVVPELARICWLIVDFWLPFEELSGAPAGPADLHRGVDLILLVLRPYLTAPARAALEAEG